MSWPTKCLRAWNEFFHNPVSPSPVAVYRIVLGFAALANQLLLLPNVAVWFGARGVLSTQAVLRLAGVHRFSLLDYLPANDVSVWLLFGLSCLVAFTFMIGLFTRVSAICLFLLLVTFAHRNGMILMSGDSFMRIGVFYLIFSPAGTALSIDRWLRQRRGLDLGPPALAAPWAQRLIQLQLAAIYVFTVLWKLQGSMWLDGTALYYSSRLQDFWRFPVPYLFEHMWTIRLATWGTLVVELALGTLIWIKPFRYPVIIAGLLLHAGIEYSMNIPLFGLVMTSAYVTFVDPAHLDQAVAWIRRRIVRR